MMNLLLLHGALGASSQLSPLAAALGRYAHVLAPDLPGHGPSAMAHDHFSIDGFATAVLQLLDREQIEQISIFGYSMGGYIGMYLARHYPYRIDKIVTLGTKYHWDPETAGREVKMLDPEKIAAKVPAYAQALEERHSGSGWQHVLRHTADMMLAMGSDNPLKPADYAQIPHPAFIMLGDRDKMVSLTETVNVYHALTNAQLCILPGTPHPIEQADTELIATIARRFLLS